jgi:hypothetical protein
MWYWRRINGGLWRRIEDVIGSGWRDFVLKIEGRSVEYQKAGAWIVISLQ